METAGEDASVSFGTVLDHFAESEELSSLVDALPHICSDQIALEASQERFTGENHNISHSCNFAAEPFVLEYANVVRATAAPDPLSLLFLLLVPFSDCGQIPGAAPPTRPLPW